MNTIKAPIGKTVLTLDEWKLKGRSLFGENSNLWKFKCASCGGIQSLQDFIDAGIEEPLGIFYFSCIGRWVKGRGCDWTLGGLFQIHTTEVIGENGKNVAVFEFAE